MADHPHLAPGYFYEGEPAAEKPQGEKPDDAPEKPARKPRAPKE